MKRRIFFGGINETNNKLPPEGSKNTMLEFGKDGDIEEIHLYKPNNLVIADYDWLKKNWHRVESWYNEKDCGSHIVDVQYYQK